MTTPQNGTQKVPTSTTPQIGNYDNVRSTTRSNTTQGKQAPQYNTKSSPNSLATAGVTIAAILGGIVLAILIYLWKRHKGKGIIQQNKKHFLCN